MNRNLDDMRKQDLGAFVRTTFRTESISNTKTRRAGCVLGMAPKGGLQEWSEQGAEK